MAPQRIDALVSIDDIVPRPASQNIVPGSATQRIRAGRS